MLRMTKRLLLQASLVVDLDKPLDGAVVRSLDASREETGWYLT